MSKNICWYSLNPKQKFKRYKNMLWLMFLAIIVVYIKLPFIIASFISLFFLVSSYYQYKSLKIKAARFDEKSNMNK